jgi:hypothetical protein
MTWRELYDRYARLLWTVHSAWALLSGIAVLVLAHNRYGFLRWVVLFIALTWGSTLFFSRFAIDAGSQFVRFAQSVVSYLTRVMYQETLFFLIPFYFYSATFRSWNFLYVLALAGFAVLSCFDVLFDRLLRENRWFAIGFFAFVSFSALQFFLPLLLRTRIENSAYVAAAISFVAALALARLDDLRNWRRLVAIGLAFALVLIGVRLFRPLLPPVPLRLTRLRFSGTLDPRTLAAPVDFEKEIPAAELRRGRIYAVATLFSPERIPAQMQMRFIQHDKVLRASRTLDLTARPGGFRLWDSVRLPPNGASDTVRVEVWTGGQLLGKRDVRVVP